MEWIWTNREKNRLSLFRYMLRNRIARVSDIMAEFKFSRYVAISTIDQLNSDVATISGLNPCLVIEQGDVLSCNVPLNSVPLDALKKYYLSQSTRAQIVQHLIAEDFSSWDDLALRLDVSTPTIYKERAIVRGNLAIQNIDITKDNRLAGQEEHIRLLKFSLLSIYNGQRTDNINSEIKAIADQYIQTVITPLFGHLKPSQKRIIWHIATIWSQRFVQGHFVSHQFTDASLKQVNEMSDKSQQAIAKIKELMTYFGKVPSEYQDQESRFIVLILHSLGIFDDSQTNQDVTGNVMQWWHSFDRTIQISYQNMFQTPLDPTHSRELTYAIGHTLMRFQLYPFGITPGIYNLQHFEEFAENYPIAYELGRDIINHFSKNHHLNAAKLNAILLTDLVAALAVDGHIYSEIPKVNIVLDFGSHPTLEYLLRSELAPVLNTKTLLLDQLDSTTDILITDLPRNPVGTELVYVWQGVGSTQYLIQLAADINKISMEKFQDWSAKRQEH